MHVSAYVNALSPSFWGDDADEFKPERHKLSEDDVKHNRDSPDYKFTTFGTGVRPCIGRQFAILEMKV